MLAAQADGKVITTIEGLGQISEQGWRRTGGLHPLQRAFIETGAVQCGYCTPGFIIAAKALLDHNPNPTEEEVRDALSGVLCRCTGYVKPVQAVLRAAAILRGEPVPPITAEDLVVPAHFLGQPEEPFAPLSSPEAPEEGGGPAVATKTVTMPTILIAPAPEPTRVVGKPEQKVDAAKLVQGKPAFTDDIEMRGLLYGKLLLSPHAHARITRIDTSKAKALPGVHAVLTYQDLPRVPFTTAGQSHPEPGPHDQYSLDYKVRFVGDRVAAVAAETPEIAERALELIEVEYEVLPAVLDPEDAMKPGAPMIHDEPESWRIEDPTRNLAARIDVEVGNVDAAMAKADFVFEGTYRVPQVQQSSIEPHVVVTWWDENDRLVIRTSTQVPFHVRRILAPVLGLPPKRIRVIKPRIGGGFGGKQEVLIEDICAHLTIATGRPVRLEYTRAEEFSSARSRHPQILKIRTGVMRDGTIVANDLYVLANTGAYGTHALTVQGNTGAKALGLYPGDGPYRQNPNLRFVCDVVYTNLPVPGAFRGYGAPQGFFAMDVHMDEIAHRLGMDPIAFRLKNALRAGDVHPLSKALGEGREGPEQIIRTCALAECAKRGAALIGWERRAQKDQSWRTVPGKPYLRRGLGVALVMHGTAIPLLDMGAAVIKINDDGSFNVMVGATDLGTGSDTVLAQMAAEVLGCPLEDIIIYSSDTDLTPFDKGAYASSTTYISGMAVVKAAQECAEQIRRVAATMLSQEGAPVAPEDIRLAERRAWAPDGRSVTLADIALESLHHKDQFQIMGHGSYVSPESPAPFAAQFAEVTVDTETGQVTVDRLIMVVDSGHIINPLTASGQIEGGMVQALGYGVSEEMVYDEKGRILTTRFGDYRIFQADEVPDLGVLFVETYEPTHPFGVKAVAEIPLDGAAPAIVNAIFDATGIRLREIPATPERVWRALHRR